MELIALPEALWICIVSSIVFGVFYTKLQDYRAAHALQYRQTKGEIEYWRDSTLRSLNQVQRMARIYDDSSELMAIVRDPELARQGAMIEEEHRRRLEDQRRNYIAVELEEQQREYHRIKSPGSMVAQITARLESYDDPDSPRIIFGKVDENGQPIIEKKEEKLEDARHA